MSEYFKVKKRIMKKVLFAVFVCVMAVVMTSCGGHPSTPRGVAEKSLNCAMKKDFKGYYDCCYYPKNKQDQKKQDIERSEEYLEAYESQFPLDYKFISEEVDEEKGRASVTFEITYPNDRVRKETIWLKKEKDGKWYIRR